MNGLNHRMRRIEEKANTAGGRRVAYCWIEPEEDEEEALAKWKKRTGARTLTFRFSLSRGRMQRTWPPQGQRASEVRIEPSIDEQIEQIVGELEADGYTLDEIATMVNKGSPEPERTPQPEESRQEPTSGIEPLKASDLVSLFARRHR